MKKLALIFTALLAIGATIALYFAIKTGAPYLYAIAAYGIGFNILMAAAGKLPRTRRAPNPIKSHGLKTAKQ